MEVKSIDNYSVTDNSIVKLTKMGNVTQIMSLGHKNNNCPIQKINKDEYVNKATGEILQCNHIETRDQNLNTVRYTIANLRNIINNNFVGGKNELWITLTFGKDKVYNPNELYSIFQKFIQRLRYKLKEHKIDYIYVPEPHEKGDWHIHLLLKSDKQLSIKNKDLREIWGQGFVKVNRLQDVDNIGAYVSAYLINIKEGDFTKKGARLHLYPAGHRIYRYSKGIKKPTSEYMTYKNATKRVSKNSMTYKSTVLVETDKGFKNLIHKEWYNSKRQNSTYNDNKYKNNIEKSRKRE